jgi:hypothetical protein
MDRAFLPLLPGTNLGMDQIPVLLFLPGILKQKQQLLVSTVLLKISLCTVTKSSPYFLQLLISTITNHRKGGYVSDSQTVCCGILEFHDRLSLALWINFSNS